MVKGVAMLWREICTNCGVAAAPTVTVAWTVPTSVTLPAENPTASVVR